MSILVNYDKDATKTRFISCECGNEVLLFSYDHDINMMDVALYQYRSYAVGKMSLRDKIRYCWQILWKGRAYCDQLVLNRSSLKELKIFLSSLDL